MSEDFKPNPRFKDIGPSLMNDKHPTDKLNDYIKEQKAIIEAKRRNAKK